jgi:hypothetical protein
MALPLLAAAMLLVSGTSLTAGAAWAQTTSGFVQVSIPNLAGQTPSFGGDGEHNLAAPAANDLWLVGSIFQKTGNGYLTPLIDRWNGVSWSLMNVPTPAGTTTFGLRGVAAASPTDVWVGGGGTANGKGFGYLSRWNGSSWRRLALPTDVTSVSQLAVAGAKDVWIIGTSFEKCDTASASSRVLHWNGTGWHSYWADDECDIPDYYSVSALFASAPETGWWIGAFDGHEGYGGGVAECFGTSCAQGQGSQSLFGMRWEQRRRLGWRVKVQRGARNCV